MFPFPADPLHLFDKSLLNHHGASLPFPPLKLDASSPLFPLSPLIFDHELLNDITLLAPPPQISPPSPPPPAASPPDIPPTHKRTVPSPATKAFCGLDKCRTTSATKVVGGGSRRLRKDRHSKIYTAQGPRDRRMRLSLDVARKFFDLQDMLGFDKASKTVDWLLTSCKTSILELTGSSSPPADPPVDAGGNGAKSESSTSEGEVISISTNHSPAPARAKRAALRRPRNASVHPPPSRESRVIARARARERTREKKMQQREFEGGGQGKRLALSSSPFETAGEESGTHTTKSSLELVAEEGQPSPDSPDQYHKRSSGASPPVITAASGPISIFDYNHDIVHNGDAISLIEEQWDIQPSGNAEEHRVLLADAQWQPWFWEAFNPSI